MRASYRDATLRLLRLSRGMDAEDIGASEWAGMLDVGKRERLVALAWYRAGERIRRLAPPEVTAQWRADVLRDVDRGENQLEALAGVLERFERASIDAVVLKGAPLAARLYGDPAARPSQDVDLYVPAGQRAAARAELEGLGWRQVAGGAPWEESFHLPSRGHQLLLEVHSWLLDDPSLVHLRLPPPEASVVSVAAVRCRAQDGDLLPACLAAHLAKHDNAPLLWLNDFSTLWGTLDEARRGSARRAALAHRLERYLEWAIERAGLLEQAAAGDPSGLERLGYGPNGRSESHGLLRLAALAAGPSDAAAVVMGRIWPPHLRGDGRGIVRQAAERLAGRLRRASRGAAEPVTSHAGVTGAPSGPRETRPLDVGRHEFGTLLEDLMHAGATTWIRARGESMEPTIPDASLVHIVPPPARPFAPGEVVLARMPNGSFAVHRILWEAEGRVAMQGDNVPRPDPIIGRRAVIGLADQVEVGGSIRSMPPRPTPFRRHASSFVRRWRRRVLRVTGRGRSSPGIARAGGA